MTYIDKLAQALNVPMSPQATVAGTSRQSPYPQQGPQGSIPYNRSRLQGSQTTPGYGGQGNAIGRGSSRNIEPRIPEAQAPRLRGTRQLSPNVGFRGPVPVGKQASYNMLKKALGLAPENVETPVIDTKREAARAIRAAINSENDAVTSYEAIGDAYPELKDKLQDIANEEKAHIGELMEILSGLDPESEDELSEGRGEVEKEEGE